MSLKYNLRGLVRVHWVASRRNAKRNGEKKGNFSLLTKTNKSVDGRRHLCDVTRRGAARYRPQAAGGRYCNGPVLSVD